jgi:hypothetical protein
VGVVSIASMPVDLFPQIDMPVVVVATFYSGMPPQQIEADITDTFERFFTGHKLSFFGDLHCMGRDGFIFYTETKNVTSTWFTGTAIPAKFSTWDGTMTRG